MTINAIEEKRGILTRDSEDTNSSWYVSSHNAKIFESGASGKRVLTRNGYLSKTTSVIVSFE